MPNLQRNRLPATPRISAHALPCGSGQLREAGAWYWSQHGGGDLSQLANALVASGYPDGTGYAWNIYTNTGGDTGTGWTPYGGATPGAWQFTDRADVAGLTVDCNAYRGGNICGLFWQGERAESMTNFRYQSIRHCD